MFGASKSGKLPGTPDPQFNYVTALLHGDGTNGAQNNTFLDSSSNNLTITRTGTPTQGSFSPYGSLWSNYFNGSTDFINAPSSTALGFGTSNFTMEMWVFSGANGTGTRLGGNGTGGAWAANKWIITTSTPGNVDKFCLGTNNSSSDLLASTSTFNNNQWMHVAITRSGNSWAMFVNGTRESTATSSISLDGGGSNTLYLGKSNVSGDGLWAGYVSNFRIVIGTAVYNPASTTITVPTTPLTAITNTQLLTCQSNRFIDNSTNNLTISTGGTPSVQRFNPFLPTYSQAYSTSVYGGSGYFNGSTDYLTTPSTTDFNFGANNFTVEFWLNTNATTGNIINPTSSGNWALFLLSGSFYWNNAYNVTNLFTVSATSILNNAWHHVAFVRSSGTIYVYYDGVLQTSNADPTVYTSAASTWNIGNGNVAYFNGYLCDLRVNNGTAVYTSAFTPPTAPLTAITNTKLLLSYQNGAIYDNAMMNDLITVGSAQISTSVKKYGTGSLSFNGSTDYLKAPANLSAQFGLGNFTIECWIYYNSVGNSQIITAGGGGVTNAIYWQLYSGFLSVGYNGVGSITNYAWTPSSSTWYYLAVVGNSGTITQYINGTSVSSASYSTAFVDAYIQIGYGGAGYLNGYIDDLRITKGYARYTSNFTPPTAALPNYGS